MIHFPESDALWELAQTPGEQFWYRFVEESTLTPEAAEKLSHTAESIWIAAVGLEMEKRELAEKLLFERLNAAELSKRQKFDLARAALTLGDLSPAHSQLFGNILVEILPTKEKWLNDHWQVATLLVDSMQQLKPSESSRILNLVRLWPFPGYSSRRSDRL